MTATAEARPDRLLLRFGVILPLLAGAALLLASYAGPVLSARERMVDGVVATAEVLFPAVGYPVRRDPRDPRVLRAADGHGVRISRECDAVVPVILLVAAAAVSPVSRLRRVMFMVAGTCLLLLLNQVRIGHLLWLSQENPDAFRSAHEAWWPAGLVLAASVMFLGWARVSRARAA